MKTFVQAVLSFYLAVLFLLTAGCSQQAMSPGALLAQDQELKPGARAAESGKLHSSETVVPEEKKVAEADQQADERAISGRVQKKKASQHKSRPLEGIGKNGSEKAQKRTADKAAENSRPFIPLDRLDIAGLEEQDGNATGVSEKGEGLVLNFDQAPLKEVILSLARILRIDYIFLTEPQGQVTIHTSGTIAREELFPLFYQILEANGLTAVRDGRIYKIVAMKDAPRHLTSGQIRGASEAGEVRQEINIRIIPLEYIDTGEMAKILTPFISAEGSIISHDQSNTLVLVDHPVNIRKAMRLIESFDVNVFGDINHAVFPINYMESKELAASLQKMLSFYQRQGVKNIEIIDLEKLNSLLVLTDSEPLFQKAREFIETLDQPRAESEPHIYIYFIKNSTAEDMADLLDSIFAETREEEKKTEKSEPVEEEKKGEVGNPFAQKDQAEQTTVTRKTPVADFGSGTLRGEIKITSDEIRNALIIEALPSDYQIVKRVLERLDILPRQVLISVTIAEVQLDDSLNLGMEWSWTHNSDDVGINNSTWSALISGDAGLSYAIGEADEWSAALSALAQKQKVDILSSPSVLASDNKEAQINIATEVPVASAQIRYNDDNVDRTQTDIQYRNTGVILNVTPHINENGLVSMEINQEVSNQSGAVQVGGTSYPSFFKRSINTTLTVNNGQTIVIGGLISEDASDASNGVPFLSDLPVLGWLFGTMNQRVSKSELIVLIKPTVVASLHDVDAVTSEFTRKIGYDL